MTLHFAFRVSLHMVLSACHWLSGLGITPRDVQGQPTVGPVVLGWVPAASVYFRDPDGHMLELICSLDAPSDPGFGVAPYADWITRHGPPGSPD